MCKSQLFVSVVAIGVDLTELRDVAPHGSWGRLLGREFQWTQRTAESYMNLARHFADKIEPFSDLNVTTARTLIAPSTPAEIRDEVFARAKAGEKISGKEVRKLIAEARDAGQEPPEKEREIASSGTVQGKSDRLRNDGAGKSSRSIRRAVIMPPVPPPTTVSPAEEVLEALLNYAHVYSKYADRRGAPGALAIEPRCDPYDVAALAMEGTYDNRRRDIIDGAEFAHDVASAMLDKEASPQLRRMAALAKQEVQSHRVDREDVGLEESESGLV